MLWYNSYSYAQYVASITFHLSGGLFSQREEFYSFPFLPSLVIVLQFPVGKCS
jgi:hypothetical protein